MVTNLETLSSPLDELQGLKQELTDLQQEVVDQVSADIESKETKEWALQYLQDHFTVNGNSLDTDLKFHERAKGDKTVPVDTLCIYELSDVKYYVLTYKLSDVTVMTFLLPNSDKTSLDIVRTYVGGNKWATPAKFDIGSKKYKLGFSEKKAEDTKKNAVDETKKQEEKKEEEKKEQVKKSQETVTKSVETSEQPILSEIFEGVEAEYLNHLALGRDEKKEIKDAKTKEVQMIQVPLVTLNDSEDELSTGTYKSTSVNLFFDKDRKILVPKNKKREKTSYKMPELFGFERKFTVNINGKLSEDPIIKAMREKVIALQKDKIDTLLSVAGKHIIPKSGEVSDMDIDGTYEVTFVPSGVTLKSGVDVSDFQEQFFNVKFKDVELAKLKGKSDEDILDALDMTIASDLFVLDDKRGVTDRFFVKDLYSYFRITVKKNTKGQEVFNFDLVEKPEKPTLDEKFLFTGLPEEIIPFYKKTEEENGALSFTLIDAEAGDQYRSLNFGVIETTANQESLKAPETVDIYPLGEDLDSVFMDEFRASYDDMFTELTAISGVYIGDELTTLDIEELIMKQNKSLKEKVYPIFNPDTQEYQYFTAEKDENKIIFKEDMEIQKLIREQRDELKKRFEKIKAIYDKEKLAQKTLLDTAFESVAGEGAYNLGLLPDSLVRESNQNSTILDPNYDPSKVTYEVKTWMSPDITEVPPKKKEGAYDMKGYTDTGLLFFTSTGLYDKERNKKYGDKEPVNMGTYDAWLAWDKDIVVLRERSGDIEK